MWRWLFALVLAGHAAAQAPPDSAVGRKIFESQCALCHGQTGGGGRGPALNRPKIPRAPDDAALRTIISEGIPPDMPASWQLHTSEVASLAVYVRSLGALAPEKVQGNSERGAKIFQSKGCTGCHIVAGNGQGFGPELSTVGARRSATFLRQTVLKPSATLPEGFQFIAVTPASGSTVRGIKANEDSFTIQLKDSAGKFHSFRKSELNQLQRLEGQTPMPAYEGQLSPAELDDLVAYLASLKEKS